MRKILLTIGLSCLFGLISSCTDFLTVKPDVKLAIPESLADLRALLADEYTFNWHSVSLIEMGVDDYYLPQTVWATRPAFEQDVYLWKPRPVYDSFSLGSHWGDYYMPIAVANIVLESLVRNDLLGSELGRQLKGEALFMRSFQFMQLIHAFAPAYDPQTAAKDLAPPMRLNSSIDLPTTRISLAEGYVQLVADLKEAEALLPVRTHQLTRADKLTVQSALARVYLCLGDYEQALQYADAVLEVHPKLMDFNTLDLSHAFPFQLNTNTELLYYATGVAGNRLLSSSRAIVDTLLYNSFATDDLRRAAFFNARRDGYFSFKGYYSASDVSVFAGIASNELYLIKAECLMRQDKLAEGMEVLNHLLKHRWKTDTFIPFEVSDKVNVLKLLFAERRKELMRRGLRWMDLKRLNKEPDFATTLVRKMLIDGKEEVFELPANDLRYMYLIPDEIINLTGIPQNPR